MYRFYSVSEAVSAETSDSDQPFFNQQKRRPTSVHQGLLNSLPSVAESTSLSPMLATSTSAAPTVLHVPQHSNGTSSSPIFGVGVGILLGQPPSGGLSVNGGHRRSIFARQKSEDERKEADRKRRLTMPLVYRMYESQSEELCGTVRGPDDDDFHPEEASKSLREALSAGIQSRDQILIDVLLKYNNFQRQKICTAYANMFGRVLADDVEEETGGHFADTILALLTPAHVYSARILYFAISGKSVPRSVAIELGLTSTISQLKVIRDTYQNEFRTSLERDLNIKVEGIYGKILAQSLLRKDEFGAELKPQSFDHEDVERMVDAIIAEGNVEELGRSLEMFNRVFGLRSLAQIRAFVQRFDQRAIEESMKEGITPIGGGGGREVRAKSRERIRDFETSIRKSTNIHSDVKQAILLYVMISKNMQLYFAEKLHEAISPNRPDHSSIIRILVSRSEIDLYDICNEYKRRFGHHIAFDLQNICSGDFLRLLRQLVNPSDLASGDDVFA